VATDCNVSPNVCKLPISKGGFVAIDLNNNKAYVDLLAAVNAIANENSVPPSFATGTPFSFWAQYADLVNVIDYGILYSLIVVICTTTTLIMLVADHDDDVGIPKRIVISLWGGILITLVIAMLVYELYGFAIYSGIKISAIPAVSLIMAVGVGVDFTAYLALAFINSAGTRDERMGKALDIMFAPLFDGGLSIVFGVLLLSISPFVFIIKYFFLPYILIVIFGFFNGLFVLPVLLSLVGPPAMNTQTSSGETKLGNRVAGGQQGKADMD